jgi:hypothetical protein
MAENKEHALAMGITKMSRDEMCAAELLFDLFLRQSHSPQPAAKKPPRASELITCII